MIYFVISFTLGIVFEKYSGFGWSASLLVFLVSLFLFLFLRKESGSVPRAVFLLGIAFCLGMVRMNFTDVSPDPELSKFTGQKVSFESVISDEPDVRDTSARYIVRPDDSRSFVLLAADRYPELKYGDKIKVSGRLDLPENFTSDNGTEFDYVSYLLKDKINFTIYRPQIEKTGKWEGNKIVFYLYSLKSIFIEKISAVVPEPNSSLVAGMIFGTKQSLGAELLEDFKRVGLVHIIVLSGYNITVIAAGIFYATSFFGKRNLSFILSAAAIFLFSLMVGFGATVVRACIMALIAILAKFLGRPAEALRWLFIAGILMLLWNPLILFYDPSFQLSFMATLGLILFSPFVFSFISKSKFQKFIPTKFGIREIVASTLAVQFFVLPLLIKMSGFVSLVSFLINPIILPLVPWVMASGALTGGLGLLPFIGEFISWPFGVVSYFISQIIISATELFSNLSLAALETGSVSLFGIFIWYAFYVFIYLKLKNKNRMSIETMQSFFQ